MKVKEYEKQVADNIINKLTHDGKFFIKGRRNNDVVDLCIAVGIKLCYNNEQSKDEFYNHMNIHAILTSDKINFIQRVDTIGKYIPSGEDDMLSYLIRDVDYYMI